MKAIILKLIVIVIITNIQLMAQVTAAYEIKNNSGCSLNYDYKIFDNSGCGSCENVTGQTVSANSSNWINSFGGSCSSSSLACDIRITITLIGGTTVNLVFDGSSFSTNPNPIGPIGTCISTSGNVVWNSNALIINP